MTDFTVSQIAERRNKAIDAAKAEFWRERDRAAALRKIEAAEREYQQAMWRHLHRALVA